MGWIVNNQVIATGYRNENDAFVLVLGSNCTNRGEIQHWADTHIDTVFGGGHVMGVYKAERGQEKCFGPRHGYHGYSGCLTLDQQLDTGKSALVFPTTTFSDGDPKRLQFVIDVDFALSAELLPLINEGRGQIDATKNRTLLSNELLRLGWKQVTSIAVTHGATSTNNTPARKPWHFFGLR